MNRRVKVDRDWLEEILTLLITNVTETATNKELLTLVKVLLDAIEEDR